MNSFREEQLKKLKQRKNLPPMESGGVFMKNIASSKWKDRM